MNERIREILTQCQQESIDGPEYPHWTDFEKFAELIVRQMLEITDAHTEVFQTDRDRAVIEHIKQSVKTHFGVEE
jgi:predicted ATPase